MGRPVYTPKAKINSSLFTSGKEWMTIDSNEEYIGYYHTYPNKAVFSDADFTEQSVELIPYTAAIEGKNNSIYFKLKGTRFNNYTEPEFYIPILTAKDYKKANFVRYFVQRKNDLSQIIEISKGAYNKINSRNVAGIDSAQYDKTAIPWTITGPKDIVRVTNQRVLSRSKMIGLSIYLTDLLEFYKY